MSSTNASTRAGNGPLQCGPNHGPASWLDAIGMADSHPQRTPPPPPQGTIMGADGRSLPGRADIQPQRPVRETIAIRKTEEIFPAVEEEVNATSKAIQPRPRTVQQGGRGGDINAMACSSRRKRVRRPWPGPVPGTRIHAASCSPPDPQHQSDTVHSRILQVFPVTSSRSRCIDSFVVPGYPTSQVT